MESLQTRPPGSTCVSEEGQLQPPELAAPEVGPGGRLSVWGRGRGEEDRRRLGFSSSGSLREGRFPGAVGH